MLGTSHALHTFTVRSKRHGCCLSLAFSQSDCMKLQIPMQRKCNAIAAHHSRSCRTPGKCAELRIIRQIVVSLSFSNIEYNTEPLQGMSYPPPTFPVFLWLSTSHSLYQATWRPEYESRQVAPAIYSTRLLSTATLNKFDGLH